MRARIPQSLGQQTNMLLPSECKAHVTVMSLQSFLKVHLADHTLMFVLILQDSATPAAQTELATSAAQPKLATSAAAKAAEAQAAVQLGGSKSCRSRQPKAPSR